VTGWRDFILGVRLSVLHTHRNHRVLQEVQVRRTARR
jgi:hypothetical protein